MILNRFKILSNICLIAVCVVCILLLSCADSKNGNKTNAVNEKKTFPLPEIPSMITEVEHRTNYLLQNYWNNFDFTDTVMVKDADISEKGLVDYISIMSSDDVKDDVMNESIDKFCAKMECNGFSRMWFMNLMDRYLYNPDSPYYNERIYGAYLRRMAKSNFIDEYSKASLKFSLKLIERNNPGDVATQFTYYLVNGDEKTLMNTDIGENCMLVIFYDPLCDSCHKVMKELKGNGVLRNLVDDNKLTVLAIYTEGDEETWKKSLKDIPESWIAGTDRLGVKDKALYDLKAMPSLYLIGPDKRVILKDASPAEVMSSLDLL